ncbi:MAG: bestrophin family ion channel [Bacteroidota bacterium]|nr:bestrophin family ion channel [Bacteroidota bacterium]
MKLHFWFSSVQHFHKTPTLLKLTSASIVVAYYVLAIILVEDYYHINFKPNPTIFSLMGLVLGLLLVFRTNTAYDRWWEGRRMLGELTNQTRALAMKLNAFLPNEDYENRHYFATMIGNYGIAMKEHLRKGVKFEELEMDDHHELEVLQKSIHVPNKIASLIYMKINNLYKNKKFTEEQFLVIDRQMTVFTDVVGACERIKNTPIPFAYTIHLKKFIFFYILILPFALIYDLHYWSIILMVIIFYAFTGLEVIGEEIEDPFGKDMNDLPTDSISINIKKNIFDILLTFPQLQKP